MKSARMYSYCMVLVFTATLLAYVHHVTCQEHKVPQSGVGRGRRDRDREDLLEGEKNYFSKARLKIRIPNLSWNFSPKLQFSCPYCSSLYVSTPLSFMERPYVWVWIWVRLSSFRGTRWRSWLRHCATSRKVAGSIPDGVILPAALWPWDRLSL